MPGNKEPQPVKAGVMGWPVDHSLSPALHGWWLEKYGIHGTYEKIPVPAAQLQDALAKLIDDGYAGCNLTIPLKEAALPLMDSHDDSCLASGAVNTVVVKNGKLKGFDSDGYGFLENLKSNCPDWRGDKVVVVGTGGAARAIIAALKSAGAQKFTLVNRTVERAEKVAAAFDLDADVRPWDERAAALDGATLLVNGSSLGMRGQMPLDLDLARLPKDAVVCDLVYRPRVTALIQSAAARGNPTVEGIGMLVHQGRLGFEKWFGQDPQVTPDLLSFMQEKAAG